MPVIISLVICTYNRAEMLRNCLATLLRQTEPRAHFEVIVVDNNSTDDTNGMLKKYLEEPYIRGVTELNAGLSHARNRGLEEATGEYVAFLDDDVLIPSRWVENAVLLIREDQALDGCGGPLYPFYTTAKPHWYEDAFDIQMGTKEMHYLEPGKGFIGANMIWHRGFLEAIGGFRSQFGLVGDSLKHICLGEETDAYHRAWQVKPSARFLFSPQLYVEHWVPPWKMMLAYKVRRLFFTGFYDYSISRSSSFRRRLSSISWISFDLLKTLARAGLRTRYYCHWKRWCYRELGAAAISVGKLSAAIGSVLPRESDRRL